MPRQTGSGSLVRAAPVYVDAIGLGGQGGSRCGQPCQIVVLVLNLFGDWRILEFFAAVDCVADVTFV
jgi:hypothetical protein